MRLNKSTRIIFLTIFIDLLGFGIIIPILAPISAQYLPDKYSGPGVALLMASFSILQMIFSPFWGSLSDRYGRRPILLLSLVGSTTSYFMFAFSHSYWLLLFSRIFAGACGGNVTAAQAFVADVTETKDRTAGMGLVGMAFGMGFALGPVAGGFASWLAEKYFQNPTAQFGPGLLAGSICLINLLWAVARLPESLPPEKRGKAHFRRFASTAEAIKVLRNPITGALILFFFLSTFAFSNVEMSFSLYASKIMGSNILAPYFRGEKPASDPNMQKLEQIAATDPALRLQLELAHEINFRNDRRGAEKLYAGIHKSLMEREDKAGKHLITSIVTPHIYYYFLFIGLVIAFTQGYLLRRLVHYVPDTILMISGTVILTAGLLLLPVIRHEYPMLLPLGILALGNGLTGPAVLSLISKSASADRQGNVFGTSQAASSLARIVGPIFAGGFYFLDPRAPFWAGAAVMAFAVWWGIQTRGRIIQLAPLPPSAGDTPEKDAAMAEPVP